MSGNHYVKTGINRNPGRRIDAAPTQVSRKYNRGSGRIQLSDKSIAVRPNRARIGGRLGLSRIVEAGLKCWRQTGGRNRKIAGSRTSRNISVQRIVRSHRNRTVFCSSAAQIGGVAQHRINDQLSATVVGSDFKSNLPLGE